IDSSRQPSCCLRARFAAMTNRKLPVVRMWGSGRKRGETYGEEARHLVRDHVARWSESLAPRLSISIDEYLDELLERAWFVGVGQQITAGWVAEGDGMAGGRGVDSRRVMALNLMDEDWWFRTRFSQPSVNNHCSAFAIPPLAGQPTVLGQNMDLRGLDG